MGPMEAKRTGKGCSGAAGVLATVTGVTDADAVATPGSTGGTNWSPTKSTISKSQATTNAPPKYLLVFILHMDRSFSIFKPSLQLGKDKRNLLVAPSSMPFGNQGIDEAVFYVYRVLSSNTTSFDRGNKIGLIGPETGDI